MKWSIAKLKFQTNFLHSETSCYIITTSENGGEVIYSEEKVIYCLTEPASNINNDKQLQARFTFCRKEVDINVSVQILTSVNAGSVTIELFLHCLNISGKLKTSYQKSIKTRSMSIGHPYFFTTKFSDRLTKLDSFTQLSPCKLNLFTQFSTIKSNLFTQLSPCKLNLFTQFSPFKLNLFTQFSPLVI